METNHEVLRHLQSCQACPAELETRTWLKHRLKRAVQGTAVPEGLKAKVGLHVRGQGFSPALERRIPRRWNRWPRAMGPTYKPLVPLAAAHYRFELTPCESAAVRLRLAARKPARKRPRT
ncbi:MAG: hypothetical protein LC130_21085 [Bryobacterales bacterium]|nr:hypothetical protein [Bryobacterales bacterium]